LVSINKGAIYDEIPNDYLNTHYYKGNIFKKLKEENKVFYHFKKADSVYDANPEDIVPEIRDIQEYFVKYYGKDKDFNNQLIYINRLLYVDSIMDSYKKNLNKTIEKEYDRPRLLKEKQSIIDGLEAENKQSNYAIWGLIGLSVLILTLTIRFYYLKRQYKTRFNRLIEEKTKDNTIEKVEVEEELQGISEHIITSVLNQLKTFEDEAQFLDKTITLANLSKRFNTNSSYLSKIINHYNEKNFNSYLTDLRVNYCIEQLQANKGLRNYTIKAIAEEVGFKNSESFAKAFFKTTGIYPSYFLKQIEKQKIN
jgi:AraC-like DNA-binding protein